MIASMLTRHVFAMSEPQARRPNSWCEAEVGKCAARQISRAKVASIVCHRIAEYAGSSLKHGQISAEAAHRVAKQLPRSRPIHRSTSRATAPVPPSDRGHPLKTTVVRSGTKEAAKEGVVGDHGVDCHTYERPWAEDDATKTAIRFDIALSALALHNTWLGGQTFGPGR